MKPIERYAKEVAFFLFGRPILFVGRLLYGPARGEPDEEEKRRRFYRSLTKAQRTSV